ncbi:aspartyl protease [Calothrix sp. HK-06]|nr:aspartyl protease [Calothrix sp. HK-06]
MIFGRFGDIGELLFDIDLITVNEELFPIEVLLNTGFTTGWLALDTQDVDALGWNIIERNNMMRMARGESAFDIYEGKVLLDEQEYIIPVLAGDEITESILGLQWLTILPLSVNYGMKTLTLG